MIKLVIYTIWIAILHSLWEIQIEGKDGWARTLPTFRINVFFRKVLGGKSLTGYHIFMLIIFISLFHSYFLFNPWTSKSEFLVLSMFSFYFVLEDFLWFVFNKHYGIKKFRPGKIKWHKRWLWGLPISYWFGLIISLITFLLSKFGGKL